MGEIQIRKEDLRRLEQKIEELKGLYPSIQSVILPSLYEAEKVFGWLSTDAIEEISFHTGISAASIKGTATFYAMYRNKPLGRHLIQLCTNVACMVLGAERLVDLLREKYGLEPGGTTEDNRFSLLIMECIGACDRAPAMLINTDYHDDLTEEIIITILDRYR